MDEDGLGLLLIIICLLIKFCIIDYRFEKLKDRVNKLENEVEKMENPYKNLVGKKVKIHQQFTIKDADPEMYEKEWIVFVKRQNGGRIMVENPKYCYNVQIPVSEVIEIVE